MFPVLLHLSDFFLHTRPLPKYSQIFPLYNRYFRPSHLPLFRPLCSHLILRLSIPSTRSLATRNSRQDPSSFGSISIRTSPSRSPISCPTIDLSREARVVTPSSNVSLFHLETFPPLEIPSFTRLPPKSYPAEFTSSTPSTRHLPRKL